MKTLLPILCLLLGACASDYVLPPKAIIVPVETKALRKAADGHGTKLSEAGEAGRNTTKSIKRAALTMGEVEAIIQEGLAGEDKEFASKVIVPFFLMSKQLREAEADAREAEAKFAAVQEHYTFTFNPAVGAVETAATANKEQVKHAEKVDVVVRKQAVEGLEAKAKMVKTDVWKSVWKRGALILGGVILLYLIIKFCGAAIWAWLKSMKPW